MSRGKETKTRLQVHRLRFHHHIDITRLVAAGLYAVRLHRYDQVGTPCAAMRDFDPD
jgi:hypothetical protein